MQLHLEEVKQILARLLQPVFTQHSQTLFCNISSPSGWQRKAVLKLLCDVSCDTCWSPGLQGPSLTTGHLSAVAQKCGCPLVKTSGERRGIIILI